MYDDVTYDDVTYTPYTLKLDKGYTPIHAYTYFTTQILTIHIFTTHITGKTEGQRHAAGASCGLC